MDNNNFVGNSTGDFFQSNYTYSSSPVRSHACSIHISPGLYCLRSVLQWCRPSGPPFKPSTRRSAISTICFLLLLSAGDIESNPGPARKASLPGNRLNSVTLGCYNIQSANRKAALIHDLINDFHIDILALTETWIKPDAPPSIKRDIAPTGFHVLHVHRPEGRLTRGGGLAVIYRNNIKITPHPLSSNFHPTTFELQLVRLNVPSPVALLNIYRLDGSIPMFLDELSDVVSTVCSGSTDRILLAGDLNCPGSSPDTVDEQLAEVFHSFGLTQHVQQ